MRRQLAWGIGTGAVALALAFGAAPVLAVSTPTSVTLAWTAPGDDGTVGTAAAYDVRVSTAPIDAGNFAQANAVTGAPAPLVAGSAQSMLVSGLSPSTTYWFAIRTRDGANNWSGVSNIVQWTTPASADTIRPAPLAISSSASTASSVTLAWTAVGDDSLTGVATRYDVRWSTSAITSANFASATAVTTGLPTPGQPGAVQGCIVTGLDRSVNLWFAVRVADEVNNWSALSNVLPVSAVLDAAPPAVPTGLAVSVQPDGMHLHWNPNTEPDLAGYNVYRATAAAGPYTPLDANAIATTSYVDASAPDSASLWYEVTAVDATHNESAHSAAVRVWLHGSDVDAVHLQPAYPNPSSLSDPVVLPVDVPSSGPVDGRLDIVNSAGERVRTIKLRGLAPGTNALSWDGRNDAGRITAPGVYRALLHAGGTDQVVRLVRKP